MDVNEVSATAQQVFDASATLVSTWGLSVVGAVAVLIIGRWVAGTLRKATVKGLERGKVDPALVPFLSSMVYYVLLTIVVVAVLNLFGIQTTSIIAVLGAAGLAVGLALQGTLSNFAAGTMLLLFRPFRPGDYVEVAGCNGTVSEISLFSTVLNTPDNVKVTIPNSAVYGATIKNYAANETRRVDMVMGISYDDDIQLAIDTIKRVVEKDERVLAEPELTVAVAELGDSSVNIVVRPWCKGPDYWALKFHLTRELKQELEAAGCSIPYPQRDVRLISGDTAAG
jgi:small conductance mechanosensitive channel